MDVQNAPDLHELVTPEPYERTRRGSNRWEHINSRSDQEASRSASLSPSNQTTSIFSSGTLQPTSDEAFAKMSISSADRLPDDNNRIAIPEQPNGRKRPQIHAISKLSNSRKGHAQLAEKDFDNAESPQTQNRQSLHVPNAATSTTLNRIFGGKFTASPPVSRQTSYSRHDDVYNGSTLEGSSTMPDHLYARGLFEGRYSDITVKAFGNSYKLHRIILDRSPFFSSAFSGPWLEASQKEIELHPQEIDVNITQISFELALKRLYGCGSQVEEDAAANALFATGCWLEMQDLVHASLEAIIRKMQLSSVAPILHLVTSNYYGKAGDKILAAAKAMLSRDSWLMSSGQWDEIPTELVREVISGDGFFVHDEWERYLLVKRLLNRRIKAVAIELGLWEKVEMPDYYRSHACRPTSRSDTEILDMYRSTEGWLKIYTHDFVEPLTRLLAQGIHYMHMTFEQLQDIRAARDVLGVPLVSEKTIGDALWSSLELRQKVINATEKDLTVGVTRTDDDFFGQAETRSEAIKVGTATTTPTNERVLPGKQSSKPLQMQDQYTDPVPRFWIPSADCNITLGAGSRVPVPSIALSQHHTGCGAPTQAKTGMPFSLDAAVETPLATSSRDVSPALYTTLPPLRFAVEFPRPHALRLKERVYSRTVFYAGSLWNVYIQKVRSASKQTQLGIYLHRARSTDPEDRKSRPAVDKRIDALEHEMTVRNQQRRQNEWPGRYQIHAETGRIVLRSNPSALLAQVSPHARIHTSGTASSGMHTSARYESVNSLNSYTSQDMPVRVDRRPSTTQAGLSTVAHDSMSSDGNDDDTGKVRQTSSVDAKRSNPALAPYVDQRPTIKTYFKIFAPSCSGRSVSLYESAPDNFNFSQSWGWKNSSLLTDEPDEMRWIGDDVCIDAGDSAGMRLRGEDFSDDEIVGYGGEEGHGEHDTTTRTEEVGRGKSGRTLKFMVVLGLV